MAKKGEHVEPTPQTLCFSCGNACNHGCKWSDTLDPVDGWEAEVTKIGYRVIQCPEFIPDTQLNPEDMDTDGCQALLEAVLSTASSDYITGNGLYTDKGKKCPAANRKAIDKFFRSKYAAWLFDIRNPEQIIKHLKRLAWEHDNPPEEKEGEDNGIQSVPCKANRIGEIRESFAEPDGSGDRATESGAGSDSGIPNRPAEST